MYCIECWGNGAKVFVNPILIKQKSALWLTECYHYLEHGN